MRPLPSIMRCQQQNYLTPYTPNAVWLVTISNVYDNEYIYESFARKAHQKAHKFLKRIERSECCWHRLVSTFLKGHKKSNSEVQVLVFGLFLG